LKTKEQAMKKLIKFCTGLFLAGSIDISLGILAAHLLCRIFHHPLSFWIYLAGIFFTLIPDIDAVIQKIKENKIDSSHRKFLHCPVFILLPFAATIPLSPFWAILASVCFLLHFLHDSMGNKENRPGIMWLWPYSSNYYQFGGKKRGERNLFCPWTPEELKKRRPISVRRWLEKHYGRLPAEAFTGILLLFIAAGIVIYC